MQQILEGGYVLYGSNVFDHVQFCVLVEKDAHLQSCL